MEGQIVQARSASPLALARDRGMNESAAMVLAAQAQAQIQARVLLARENPRDLDVVREKLLKECRRPGFAESARYRKPIGKGVEGMSIRFAEAAIRYMGNISVDVTTVSEDDEKRKIRVVVLDLESNVSFQQEATIEKTVERNSHKPDDVVLRSRTGSRGQQVYVLAATEDDLLNKQNALVSKAMRTAGLRLVPGDIIDECEQECLATLRDRDAQDPDAAKRRIFDSFSTIGVGVADLKKYLGHDGATLNPKELQDLRALFSAIRDGETSWKAVMDAIQAERGDEKKDEKASTGSKGMAGLKAAVQNASSKAKSEATPEQGTLGGESTK